MISDQYKFIFVHVNKTGGTSIEKVFSKLADKEDVALKHEPAAFYKNNFPDRFRTYFKFAFVRSRGTVEVEKIYLLYSLAGESGIAIGDLHQLLAQP